MAEKRPIYIGTAGWNIPGEYASLFPPEGSHLSRYAARFPAVEINTSFYRLHRPATYSRWAGTVPADFRFAVKIPRQITHNRRLKDPTLLDEFLAGVTELGDRLGPLLVQLPPSLPYQPDTAGAFFAALRERFAGYVVCEPRHPSWFSDQAEEHLAGFQVARAAADPAVTPEAAQPGGWTGLVYYRLHGSPEVYTSPYSNEYLDELAQLLSRRSASAIAWCIFDNTAAGFATRDALALIDKLSGHPGQAEG